MASALALQCSPWPLANAEATGSNPVEAPKIFFSGYFRNCLNCDSLRWSHTHFICIPAVYIISFSVSFLSRVDELNNWPASSIWVFIAQLGEHRSANAEATGSNPVEAPKIFFSGYFRNCLNCDSLRWSHTHFICIPAVHIISFNRVTIWGSLLCGVCLNSYSPQYQCKVVNIYLVNSFLGKYPRLFNLSPLR